MADSIFTGLTPETMDAADSSSTTLGTLFIPQVDGTITQIGWYAPFTVSSVAPTGRLWQANADASSGTVLATKAVASPAGGGWAWAVLDAPVAVTAGQKYVVCVRAIRYCATNDFFASTSRASPGGYLVAPMDGAGSTNGRFMANDTVGDPPSFPTSTYRSTAYFIDVVFEPATGAAAQTITAQGVGSASAVGKPTIQAGPVTVSPVGVVTASAPGLPTVQAGPVTVSPVGVASASAPGLPTISLGTVTVSPVGVATASAVGRPAVSGGVPPAPAKAAPHHVSMTTPTASVRRSI